MVCVEVVAPITGKVSSVVKASGRSSALSDDIETRQRRPAKANSTLANLFTLDVITSSRYCTPHIL